MSSEEARKIYSFKDRLHNTVTQQSNQLSNGSNNIIAHLDMQNLQRHIRNSFGLRIETLTSMRVEAASVKEKIKKINENGKL